LALTARGAEVIATDVKTPQETVRKIGPTVYALELEVSQEEQWLSVTAQTRDVGEVDIVCEQRGLFSKSLNRRTGTDDVAKDGRLGHTRHEPLHRHKDRNHWIRASAGSVMHDFKKRFRSSASPCASGVSVALRTRRLMQAADSGAYDDKRRAISVAIKSLTDNGFVHQPFPFGFTWSEGITP